MVRSILLLWGLLNGEQLYTFASWLTAYPRQSEGLLPWNGYSPLWEYPSPGPWPHDQDDTNLLDIMWTRAMLLQLPLLGLCQRQPRLRHILLVTGKLSLPNYAQQVHCWFSSNCPPRGLLSQHLGWCSLHCVIWWQSSVVLHEKQALATVFGQSTDFLNFVLK